MEYIYWAGFFLIILILILIAGRYRRLYLLERQSRTSASVRYGKFLEHYIPWIKEIFPHDPTKFRFIGNPIDGILFDDDKIVFLEFKTGNSKLSETQRKIKSLVKEKKVEWKEIKIK